jgi:hypothetical protein
MVARMSIEAQSHRIKIAMVIPIVAAIVTLLGAAGLVLSSLAPAIVGDGVFNFSAVCLVAGPLIFFFYVMIGLYMEFVATNWPPEVRIIGHTRSPYASEASLGLSAYDAPPEGLQRERKGPMNPSSGRATKI